MKIALDISPLSTGHKFRGTGFYTKYLQDGLQKYFPKNDYVFFTHPKELISPVDVVHYPYFSPFSLTLQMHNAFPTVVTVHDLTPLVFPQQFPIGLKGKGIWQLQKYFLKKVDAIITDSENSKKDIIKLTGINSAKIHVIYLAAGGQFKKIAPQDPLIARVREKYSLPKKFLLYVGDITANKNIPNLVKAILQTDIHLVTVGKALIEKNYDQENIWNRDRIEFQKLVENKPQIQNLGFITDEELVALYNMATAFVFPSTYEGFGLPLLEAMQCGTPVITTKLSSIPEVVEDSAYYIENPSTKGIKEAIVSVYTNRATQEKLSRKSILQAKKFSWEKTIRETMAIYEKVH